MSHRTVPSLKRLIQKICRFGFVTYDVSCMRVLLFVQLLATCNRFVSLFHPHSAYTIHTPIHVLSRPHIINTFVLFHGAHQSGMIQFQKLNCRGSIFGTAVATATGLHCILRTARSARDYQSTNRFQMLNRTQQNVKHSPETLHALRENNAV